MTTQITDALSCTTFAPLNAALSAKIDRKLTGLAYFSARHEAARARFDGEAYTARNTYKSHKGAERAAKKITDQIDRDWGAGTTQVHIFEVLVTERKKPTTFPTPAITRTAFVPIITVCVASCWAGYLNDSSRLAPEVAYQSIFGSFFSAAGYGARGNVVVIPFGRN